MTVVLRYYDMLLLLHLIRRLLSYLFIWVYVSWKYSLLSLVSFEGCQWWNIFFLATRASLFELVATNLRWFRRVIIMITIMSLFKAFYCFYTAITDLEVKTPIPLIWIYHVSLRSLLKSIYFISYRAWILKVVQISYRLIQSVVWWIYFWDVELSIALISLVYLQRLISSLVKFLKRFSQVMLVMRVLALRYILLILWLLILYRQVTFGFS